MYVYIYMKQKTRQFYLIIKETRECNASLIIIFYLFSKMMMFNKKKNTNNKKFEKTVNHWIMC